MTDQAEFEEKTYEKYFGQEVARHTRVTYSPGQVGEQFLGFDEAFFVPRHFYLRRFAHLNHHGWQLNGMSLSDLDHLADDVGKMLPPFKFNLFVQYKRPEFVSGNRASEWNSWSQPYFRYDITQHQQVALSQLEVTAGNRASVVYASPAFWKKESLFEHARDEQIIGESNVASVTLMNGHGRFTYVAPGGSGIAHSDPEPVSGRTFDEAVRLGLDLEGAAFRDHLLKTANTIETSFENNPEGLQLLNIARQATPFPFSADGGSSLRDRVAYAVATIEAYSDAFNVTLYAMG